MSTPIRPPRRRRSLYKPLSRIAPHILLLAFSCATLGPFLWSLFQSFQPGYFDTSWTTSHYDQALDSGPFIADYRNSIIVAGSVTISAVVTSLLVGFVLAKYRFRGRDHLFTALIAAVMIPFSAILIPVYVTVVHLGFNNSLGGLIVAGMWSPLGIFIVRQFLEGIPSELLDAARIDGASEWRIVVQLMLPLCTSALTVLAVYTFMHTFNDFLLPAILLSNPAHWTLPILLSSGLGDSTPDVSAVVVLTTLPALIVTALTTKYFIRGIALTSASE
jgi:ABC-type glycerol-3-phosphate transport system permease component